MATYDVGLDVRSRKSTFVIEDAAGKVVAQGEVASTPAGVSALVATHGLGAWTQVDLETGAVAFFVARQLSRLGLAPVVVDAHEVRLKAHRPNRKSDRRDAFELCEGLRPGDLPFDRSRSPAQGRPASGHALAQAPLRAPAERPGRCRQGPAARCGARAPHARPRHACGWGSQRRASCGPDGWPRRPPRWRSARCAGRPACARARAIFPSRFSCGRISRKMPSACCRSARSGPTRRGWRW